MKRRRKQQNIRRNRRLASAQIAAEPSGAIVVAPDGSVIKKMDLGVDVPDPADWGMVQIAAEPDGMTPYQRLVAKKREETVMREVAKLLIGLKM